jgi:hypothetical protein
MLNTVPRQATAHKSQSHFDIVAICVPLLRDNLDWNGGSNRSMKRRLGGAVLDAVAVPVHWSAFHGVPCQAIMCWDRGTPCKYGLDLCQEAWQVRVVKGDARATADAKRTSRRSSMIHPSGKTPVRTTYKVRTSARAPLGSRDTYSDALEPFYRSRWRRSASPAALHRDHAGTAIVGRVAEWLRQCAAIA